MKRLSAATLSIAIILVASNAAGADDQIKSGAIKATRVLKSDGATGLQIDSEDCYSKINSNSSRNAVSYCFAFDYASMELDRSATEVFNFPRREFFLEKNVLSRASEALSKIGIGEEGARRSLIATWTGSAAKALGRRQRDIVERAEKSSRQQATAAQKGSKTLAPPIEPAQSASADEAEKMVNGTLKVSEQVVKQMALNVARNAINLSGDMQPNVACGRGRSVDQSAIDKYIAFTRAADDFDKLVKLNVGMTNMSSGAMQADYYAKTVEQANFVIAMRMLIADFGVRAKCFDEAQEQLLKVITFYPGDFRIAKGMAQQKLEEMNTLRRYSN